MNVQHKIALKKVSASQGTSGIYTTQQNKGKSMNTRQLKDMLKESLDIEKELYDFCIEALTKIYGDKAKIAIHLFEESYQHYDYNGCLQSLFCIDSQFNKEVKRISDMK